VKVAANGSAVINRRLARHLSDRLERSPKASAAAGLLQRCQAGDQSAWRELFHAHAAQIYRWGVLLGLNSADAEDAAQEVLATAARRIHRCRAEEALPAWLYQITRRIAANYRRRRWLRGLVGGDDDSQLVAAFVHETRAAIEAELDLRRLLRRLPRAQAEVLLLVEIEGFTRHEVARMLGLPPGTVASRLRLARRALRGLSRQGTTELSWGAR
jgi:RNA polymerase sigma-70 factor (ECF subfamily)